MPERKIPGLPEGTFEGWYESEPAYNPTWEASKRVTEQWQELERAKQDLYKDLDQLRTELLHTQEEVQKLAFDPVTGLLSHGAFAKMLPLMIKEAEAAGKVFTLLVGDPNSVKYVNDKKGGHPAGDSYIKRSAQPLLARFPEQFQEKPRYPKDFIGHNFVAGKRGEELFAAYISDTPEEAKKVAQEIFDDLKHFEFTTPSGEVLMGSVALGGSIWDETKARMKAGGGLGALFKEADAQMYAMKQASQQPVDKVRVGDEESRRLPPEPIDESLSSLIFKQGPEVQPS